MRAEATYDAKVRPVGWFASGRGVEHAAVEQDDGSVGECCSDAAAADAVVVDDDDGGRRLLQHPLDVLAVRYLLSRWEDSGMAHLQIVGATTRCF